MSTIQHRYDFVYYFDCQDGNPNGDPDADNQPRTDLETTHGLVSDVCLKRKVRDYVFHSQQENGEQKHGYDIFVLAGNTLESRQRMPYDNLKLDKSGTNKGSNISIARSWMCENFFDIRAFGAVNVDHRLQLRPGTGTSAVHLRALRRSRLQHEHTISRQAFTGEKDIKNSTGTFGKKHTLAYGLYRMHGFINPVFADLGADAAKAKGTGFSEDDLGLLWKALAGMFDLDRSAARGLMSPRELVVFKHGSRLGDAPAQHLFETVSAKKRADVAVPRSFADYQLNAPPTGALSSCNVEVLYPLRSQA